MIFRTGRGLRFPPTFRLALLLHLRMSSRKCQPFHLDMADVHLANIALNQRESGLHGITRHADLPCPDISSPTRDEPNNAVPPLGVHHAIDYLVQRPIAPIGDHEIVARLGGLGRQIHRLPSILFEGEIDLPASRCEDGKDISDFCQILSCPWVQHQHCLLALHTKRSSCSVKHLFSTRGKGSNGIHWDVSALKHTTHARRVK